MRVSVAGEGAAGGGEHVPGAAVNNTAGGLKTALSFSDLLEGLAELNKTVLLVVWFVTAK